MTVLLIAFAASHGYFFLRVAVRHLIQRLFWEGSKEVEEQAKVDGDIKNKFLQGLLVESRRGSQPIVQPVEGSSAVAGKEFEVGEATDLDAVSSFWDNDEGLEEISRVSKEV